MVAVIGLAPAQSMNRVEKSPHIVISLPDNIGSDSVTIWYGLLGEGARVGPVKREPDVRQYTIDGYIGGQPAQYATVYVYAPGCEFKTYDFELRDASDVEQSFECVPLPTKIVSGFLPPAEMPATKFPPKELEVMGYLEANWMCSDVFNRNAVRSHNRIVGGSCFVPEIRLGSVGQFNRASGGQFEIRIPDFTKDPAFNDHAKTPTALDFGWIELALEDKHLERLLETIEAKGLNSPKHGLIVQPEYPDPIIFTRVVN